METVNKVTVQIPSVLLKKAQKTTGSGITSTIRKGLELLAASQSYEALLRLEGKVKFSVDYKTMREDRS